MFFPLKTPRFWETYFLGTALSGEFQKSLAAEGRLRKDNLRLAKYAVSL
jgi:hypothetical protein